ncbi:zinc-binding protein A33-like isoform X2 [Stegostoma tigrinum]|uniref:zinc-binding protein A33-like isoform X2 n=1 Tax=Stegostoma tigrinum TaxID=3053191 RepID=UPI00202B35CD|nr:zinc-binding protein A33-like isoform X2 [Stegostoma tigrinum]
MASANDFEKMRSQVSCFCCGDFYRDPVTLQCGHNFCRACVAKRWEAAGGAASCPRCRETLPEGAQLRTNRLLHSLVESIQELSVTLSQRGGRCRSHDETVDMFCQDDHRAMCVVCSASRDHNGHTVVPLKEAAGKCEEKLRALKVSLESKLKEYSKSQDEDKADQVKLKTAKYIIPRSHNNFKKPTKVSVDLNLDELIGPVQYITWRRLLRTINPAPEFVTLDPMTAHPHLKVSDDLSHVRRSETAQAVPYNLKRFSNRHCVLGSKGFTSGRHYWEVDVGSCTFWVLGVASESISRCGNLPLAPEAGVWAIELRWQDGYKALSSPPACLARNARPKRLGIYLDYEGGWVVFYDAADMSHLYTFSDTFREKLYPYFSTSCKADSLRVISLQM